MTKHTYSFCEDCRELVTQAPTFTGWKHLDVPSWEGCKRAKEGRYYPANPSSECWDGVKYTAYMTGSKVNARWGTFGIRQMLAHRLPQQTENGSHLHSFLWAEIAMYWDSMSQLGQVTL